MTDEQEKISYRNKYRARKYFIEHGIIPVDAKPYSYVMHHYAEHTRHHHTGLVWNEESRDKLRGKKNGANTHPEKNNFINDNPGLKLVGTHYYNNGITELRAKECPEGFTKGRLPGCFGRKVV